MVSSSLISCTPLRTTAIVLGAGRLEKLQASRYVSPVFVLQRLKRKYLLKAFWIPFSISFPALNTSAPHLSCSWCSVLNYFLFPFCLFYTCIALVAVAVAALVGCFVPLIFCFVYISLLFASALGLVLVWFGLVWFGLVWFGLVWFGLVWFGLVWFGLVWFGLVWFG